MSCGWQEPIQLTITESFIGMNTLEESFRGCGNVCTVSGEGLMNSSLNNNISPFSEKNTRNDAGSLFVEICSWYRLVSSYKDDETNSTTNYIDFKAYLAIGCWTSLLRGFYISF